MRTCNTKVGQNGNVSRRVVLPVVLACTALCVIQNAKAGDARPRSTSADSQQSNSWLENAIAQNQSEAAASSQKSQQSYAVDGLAIGTRVSSGSPTYREYQCIPSEQFAGFTWCTRMRSDRERRGSFEASYSLLHAQDGTVVYANRFQTPAFWGATEIQDDIAHYSARIGGQPSITEMPNRPGLPRAILATWGRTALQPLDSSSLNDLAEGKPIKKGLLVPLHSDYDSLVQGSRTEAGSG
jgi:hypothetical protein